MKGVARDRYFDQFGRTKVLTRARLIKEIQRFARERGRPPRQCDWDKKGRARYEFGKPSPRTWPSAFMVTLEFGSFNAGLEEAGFPPNHPGGKRNERTCKYGRHPWVPENIHVYPSGKRGCRECQREAEKRRKRDKEKKRQYMRDYYKRRKGRS